MPVILNGPGTLKPDEATAAFADGSDLYCSADTGYSNPSVSAGCTISLVEPSGTGLDEIVIRCNTTYTYIGNVHLQSVADEWTITIEYE